MSDFLDTGTMSAVASHTCIHPCHLTKLFFLVLEKIPHLFIHPGFLVGEQSYCVTEDAPRD